MGATSAARDAHRRRIPAWLIGLACALWLLLGGPASRAASAEDETMELVRLVDHHPNAAIAEGDKSLLEAQRSGDKARELRAWRLLALAHNELVDMVALRRDIAAGEPLALKLGNIEAQCQFLAARAAVERNAARYDESYALFDQAIALTQQHGRVRMRAALYLDKAMTAIEHGRQSDAVSMLVTAHALFEELHDKLGTALTLDSMGTAALISVTRNEEAAGAIRYHEQALELLDPAVNRSAVITVYYNIGKAYARIGDLAQARKHIQRGLDMTYQYQGPVGAAYFEYTLARVLFREKQYEQTLVHIDRALPGFRLRGDLPLMVFVCLTTRADVLSQMGRYGDSLRTLAEAKVPLAELNSPTRDAAYHQLAATVHERAARYEEAYAALKEFGQAEQRRIEAAKGALTAELQTRFDVQRKDSENALLRLQQQESGARRMALVLGLLLCLVVLGVGAVYLVLQMRRSRRFAALALRDELTGLPNRRSITEFARLQWAARSGQEGKLRVAILDIDHFKGVNDEFGHGVGDAVLKAFAQACDGKLRRTERLGRYGGEEFLLIMPASEAAHVAIVFRRLQEAVHDMHVPGLPGGRHLSFSMGAAEAWDNADNLEAMIQRADEALYLAKRNGRNRFELAPHLRLASVETRPAAVPVPLRASSF